MRRIPLTPKEKARIKRNIALSFLLSLILGGLFFYLKRNIYVSSSVFIFFFIAMLVFLSFAQVLEKTKKIKKMEDVFPDFLQLVASNLRAGMTIEKSIMSSIREEFAPLDKEIMHAGKDITTGKSVEYSLVKMSKRIGSEKIEKTIMLIISGLKAGGNISILLEETARSTRERNFVEKKAASSVMMYAIFIFAAVTIGAPLLFSLSGFLVRIMINLMGDLPPMESLPGMPFTLGTVNISAGFIKYFSLIFILCLNFLASMILGLVQKGDEREGLKYLVPMILISMVIFFSVQVLLSIFLKGIA